MDAIEDFTYVDCSGLDPAEVRRQIQDELAAWADSLRGRPVAPPWPEVGPPQLASSASRPHAPADDVSEAMAADLCPSGAAECGCGTKPRKCGRPGRPLDVWRPDCLACVRSSTWESGVDPAW